MKISFHGACREVTGSCIFVESDKFKFVVDCGAFQGDETSEEKNFADFAFNPSEINFVFLTHAHLDHCGRLPKLFKEGFSGKIYCTEPTRDLVRVILDDAVKIMDSNKQNIDPKQLYTPELIEELMKHFVCVEYREEFKVNDLIKINFIDAGHILGSSSIEVYINDGGVNKKMLFSGDIGNPPAPIIRDTEFSDGADIVCIESTYGGTFHEDKEIGRHAIRQAIIDTIKNKGVLIIPVFAIERSQEILYEINRLVENNLIPKVPFFFDSPMAIKAVEVYKKYKNFYDKEAKSLIESGDDIFNFRGLKFTLTPEESKLINGSKAPKVILAGSGMCNGGRVVHHLNLNLENRKAHVMLLSFQAKNTLGRHLMEGDKTVIINDENIKVKAKISTFGCFSSHADQNKLKDWLYKLTAPKPKHIFIEHGEEDRSRMFLDSLGENEKKISTIPEFGIKYEI